MNVNTPLSQETILENKYRIIQKLGKGGFSRTYLVENIQENRKHYLLKEFLPNHNNKTEFNQKSLELFYQEASILSKLNHPQIPKFLDWFQENNNFFIVQEYIKGDNYWQLLCKRKREQRLFSEAEIIQWFKDLLPLINYLHENKIIHRDISPDNIIYSTEINKPVLIDFGGVKQKMTEIINHGYEEIKGTIIGKIGYSAPEQFKGQCYENSDIYALGVTGLVLLTGKEPELLFNSYSRKQSWVQDLNISDQFKLIFEKILKEYPDERYASAMDVLNEINKIGTLNNQPQQSIGSEKTILIAPSNDHKFEKDPYLIYPENITKNEEKKNEDNSLKKVILFLLMTLFGLSIIGLVLQAPHINAICKKLDNCAKDKEYQKIFDETLVDGKEVINPKQTVKNINDLQSQQKDLQEVIKDFKEIPNDVKVYDQAQEELKVYENKLIELDEKIKKENKANLEFQEIVKKMDNLRQETSLANNTNKYQKLKAEWEGLKAKLNEFDGNLFISPQVSNQIIESEKNIAKIDDNLKILQAQAKAKAEQIAREKAKANTYKPSSPVVRYKPQQNAPKIARQIPKKSPVLSNHKQNITKPQRNYYPKKTPSAPPQKNISTPGSVW
ncbi:MAG: protein kinase [Cyanobacteria bacterium]|nr:protein kinase [Cyanobacteria bacterium CG_2015-16_32_12]NCO78337.1 protein kinase [Cyanobacteria bacterium CG_2015-22_32_23]NCQ03227.1 protein kinase [Cyanobacteria bacterium CG_2015-09_32_10]NCQ42359.1 protein kinase [Cyanobacteria bacterium CG_2015-04_32_10]NCS83776.1 protein kinase [Cyanobacteria bacterium CG_2015-02_32_10]